MMNRVKLEVYTIIFGAILVVVMYFFVVVPTNSVDEVATILGWFQAVAAQMLESVDIPVDINVIVPSTAGIGAFLAVFLAVALFWSGMGIVIGRVLQRLVFRIYERRLPKKGHKTKDLVPLYEIRSYWFPVLFPPLFARMLEATAFLFVVYIVATIVMYFVSPIVIPAVGMIAFFVSGIAVLWISYAYWELEWNRQVEATLVTTEAIYPKTTDTPVSAIVFGGSDENENPINYDQIGLIKTTDEIKEGEAGYERNSLMRYILNYISREKAMDNIVILTLSQEEVLVTIKWVVYARRVLNDIDDLRQGRDARLGRATRRGLVKFDFWHDHAPIWGSFKPDEAPTPVSETVDEDMIDASGSFFERSPESDLPFE